MFEAKLEHQLDLGSEITRYRVRAVVAIQAAFLFGATILFIEISRSTPKVPLSILASAFMSAVSIWLARRNQLKAAATILAAQFLILPTYLAATSLGIYDSAMMILPAGMMSIAVVANPRQVALFSLVTLAAAGIVGVFTLQGWNPNAMFFEHVKDDPIDVIVVISVVAFAGIVATYVSFILTGLLRTLVKHQITLEDSVARRTGQLAQSNDELRAAMATLDHARDELVRGEKLAGLGNLVAGVAHELNTPIGNSAMAASTLHSHADEFARHFEAGTLKRSELKGFVDVCLQGSDLIMRSTQRAHELVASFKQVAVDQTSDRRRPFDLDEVVEDVLRSLRPSFTGAPWTMDKDVAPGIVCDGYPGPLGQVLTNLIQNAVLHGFAERDRGHVQISGSAVDADYLRLTVTDNGNGIAAESLGRIFDPFFTTRLGQGGSGLGLTIVHNLATSLLGGRIEVASKPGEGARFVVTLPRVAPDRSPAEDTA